MAARQASTATAAVLANRPAVLDGVLAEAEASGLAVAESATLADGHPTVETLRQWRTDSAVDVVLFVLDGGAVDRAFVTGTRELVAETPVVALALDGRPGEGGFPFDVPANEVRVAALAQAEAVVVRSLSSCIDTAVMLAGQRPLPDESVAVVSNAGGPGVMAADAVAGTSLSLATFEAETVAAMETALPPGAHPGNPVDTLADATLDEFTGALAAVMADPGVAGVVVISAPSTLFAYEDMAARIVDTRARHDVPVVCSLMGGRSTRRAEELLADAAIPNFFDPARAVRALASLAAYARARERARTTDYPVRDGIDFGPIEHELSRILAAEPRNPLAFVDAAGVSTRVADVSTADAVPVSVAAGAGPPTSAVCLRFGGDLGQAFDDVAVGIAPVAREEADRLVETLAGAPVLRGVRGRDPVDLDALAETIRRVGRLVVDLPIERMAVDLAVSPMGVVAVDATVTPRTDSRRSS